MENYIITKILYGILNKNWIIMAYEKKYHWYNKIIEVDNKDTHIVSLDTIRGIWDNIVIIKDYLELHYNLKVVRPPPSRSLGTLGVLWQELSCHIVIGKSVLDLVIFQVIRDWSCLK